MQMERGLDSGPMLHQIATPIAPDETAGELTDALAELGAEALVEALTLLRPGRLTPAAAGPAPAPPTRPRSTADLARVDWTARRRRPWRAQVRAFDPAPGAWTTLGERRAEAVRRPRSPRARSRAGACSRAGVVTVAIGGAGGASAVPRCSRPAGPAWRSEAWVRGRGAAAGAAADRETAAPAAAVITDAAVLAADDFGVRAAAAIAAAGPAVALPARDHRRSSAALARGVAAPAARAGPAARGGGVRQRPPRPGRAPLGAHGVQLRRADLRPADARRVLCAGLDRRSVHERGRGGRGDRGGRRLPAGRAMCTRPRRTPAARPPASAWCAAPRARDRPVIAIGGDRRRSARRRGAGRRRLRRGGHHARSGRRPIPPPPRSRCWRPGLRPRERDRSRRQRRAASVARPARRCAGLLDRTSGSTRGRSWSSSTARSSAGPAWARPLCRRATRSSWCISSAEGEPRCVIFRCALMPHYVQEPDGRHAALRRPPDRHVDPPLVDRRAQLPLPPHGRHREVPQQRRDGARHRGVRRGDASRWRCAGWTSTGPRKRACSTTSIPERYFLLANTAGCYTADEAVRYARLAPRGRLQRVRQARGHRRPGDAAPRHRRACSSATRDAGARRVHGAGVHQRRSDHRAPPRGGRRARR